MTLQATFAATLVDEWVRAGIRDAVVSPGSRSSALAIALAGDGRVETHVRLDERSAGFYAIGIALASGLPVVVVTTSGTAAAELHPAVIEADLAGVPLVVCTADRPFELQDVGSPQTVDQRHLYGRAVRFFADFDVASEEAKPQWRSLGSRLVLEAQHSGRGPGPVHVNLPFREPLGGEPDDVPKGRDGARPFHEVIGGSPASEEAVAQLVALITSTKRGLIVAGRGGASANSCQAISQASGWPVLSDAVAFPRETSDGVIAAWETIVKSPFATTTLRPDVVVRVGAPQASRPFSEWLADSTESGTRHVLIDPYGRFLDPGRLSETVVRAGPDELFFEVERRLGGATPTRPFFQAWVEAERSAQLAIDELLSEIPEASEPAVARDLFALVPHRSALVVSSSMPVRDVDAFGRPRVGAPVVYANRGANGIDGVASTVRGVAAARKVSVSGSAPTVGLLGDLAFLHDLSAHVFGSDEARVGATYVVVDNRGGGIFSFLPYAKSLRHDTFERAFATPQATDISALATAFGFGVFDVDERSAFAESVFAAISAGSDHLVLVRTERERNVEIHAELDRAVEVSLVRALGAS
ncbi:MAG: 2-succinyl-5-enolpyruvyl-6-hydroxy-3-cyclohexene-1-carboxylic-acid synthase [Acidimicrobiales bacterium]